MHAAALALLLVIRTYDMAGVSPRDAERARQVATTILERANIDTRWIACAAHGTPTADRRTECADAVPGAVVMIRFVQTHDALRKGEVLGDAYVDTAARAGSLATIFVANVERLAEDASIDVGTLLGRTMAHEIGHLLLGTPAHAPRGLMRATWSPTLLHRLGAEWTFSASEQDRLAAGIARRSQP